MAENFPNLAKMGNIHIQEAERISNRIDQKKSTPRHIIIKHQQTKDKNKES